MFLVTVHDHDGTQIQINGGSIAYYTRSKAGKSAVIHFASIANGNFVTLEVAETPEQITTQIHAKLRK